MADRSDMSVFAGQLLAARKAAGMSRGCLARTLAAAPRTVRNWERGYTRIPLLAVPTIRRELGIDGPFEPFGTPRDDGRPEG